MAKHDKCRKSSPVLTLQLSTRINLRLLDSLREALKRNVALPLAGDEYDGEVRVKAMNEVAIPEFIVRIMRRLFD